MPARMREHSAPRPLILTVDVERPLGTTHDSPETAVDIILNILNTYRQKITFFVVANTDEAYPHLVPSILGEGHEVAVHSYRHRPDELTTVRGFENELKKADLITRFGLLNYLNVEEIFRLFTHLKQQQFLFSALERSWSPHTVLHTTYLYLAACPGSYRYSRSALDALLHRAEVQQWRYTEGDRFCFPTNIPAPVPSG